MSKNMIKGANLKQLEAITSAMSGTLDGFGAAGGNEWAKPQKAEWSDLCQAIDWLLSYEWGDDLETGQSYINTAEFLAGEALKKLKKNYAKANGLKVSQVKFKKAEEIVNG
jgi:formylglycine-generating enzyme required for sulfatase activity